MGKEKADIVARLCAKQKVKMVYRNPRGEYFTDMNLALLSVNGDRKKIETCTPDTAKKPVETKKVDEKGKAAKEVAKTSETKQVKEKGTEEEEELAAADAGTESEQFKAEGEDE